MWSELLKNGTVRYAERYVDYMTGKQKKVSVVMAKPSKKNEKLARDILSEKIQKKAFSCDSSDITFSFLVEKYQIYQSQVVKPSTYSRNQFAANALIKMLGKDILVSKLSAQFLKEKFLNSKRSPSSLNELRSRLLALLRWGYENEYIHDISYLAKFPKFHEQVTRKERIENKYLEPSEATSLLNALYEKNEQSFLLAKFMLLSGLRCGEAIALERSDINLDAMIISVTKTYDPIHHMISTTKTFTSTREVPISLELKKLLHQIFLYSKKQSLQLCRREPLLFLGDHGYLNYYSFNKLLKNTALEVLNRSITTHTLRHTYASMLYAEGIGLDTVSRFLGHNNSAITRDIYLHITEKQKQKDKDLIQSVQLLS